MLVRLVIHVIYSEGGQGKSVKEDLEIAFFA